MLHLIWSCLPTICLRIKFNFYMLWHWNNNLNNICFTIYVDNVVKPTNIIIWNDPNSSCNYRDKLAMKVKTLQGKLLILFWFLYSDAEQRFMVKFLQQQRSGIGNDGKFWLNLRRKLILIHDTNNVMFELPVSWCKLSMFLVFL